jgi:hypothetical protein
LNFRRLAFLANDVVDVFVGVQEDHRLIGIDSNESLHPAGTSRKGTGIMITSLNNVEPKIILIRESLKHRQDTENLLFHPL